MKFFRFLQKRGCGFRSRLFVYFVVLGSLGLFACAEKLPYKEVLKDDDTLSQKVALLGASPQSVSPFQNAKGTPITTSQLSQHEWLYVPSTVKAARGNTSFLPYMLGREKVVRFRFTREHLQVLEVEEDPRFTHNTTNQKPVLSLPVEHIEYQCARNAYNECTSSEEKSSNLSWHRKSYFKMKAGDLALQEINFLPESWENLFAPCLQQTGARLVDYRISDTAFNFQVEKYFKASLVCHWNAVRELTDLLNLSFTARLHYSFTRMDKLVSSHYTPVPKRSVPFGVFETRRHKLSLDHRDLLKGRQQLLNRWQPGRQVEIYLSPEFEKPEHKALKAASFKAVQSVNKALELAQSKTRLNLKSAPSNMQVGDTRYSTLVLEEEAPAYNVVGYGPSATNPRTGEIVYARVVMYLGVLKKMVHHAYDELVHRQKAEAAPHTTPGIRPRFREASSSLHPELKLEGAALRAHMGDNLMQPLNALAAQWQKAAGDWSAGDRSTVNRSAGTSQLQQALLVAGHPRLHSLSFENELALLLAEKNFEAARAVFMRRHNMYSLKGMPIEAMARRTALALQSRKLLDTLASDTGQAKKQLKSWRKLSDPERQKVMKKVLPFLWEPILLHELGHILGLRHNFAASEDKQNFYTAADAAATPPPVATPAKAAPAKAEVQSEPVPAFSSVMDYSGNEIDVLRRMGKYDVAALRYLYAQQLELTDGRFVGVDKIKPHQGIKAYVFCTDEHVALNPNCNPFDSGTNLTEIVQASARDYDDSYIKLNYRNGRRVFSRFDEPSYLARRNFIFRRLRLVLERFEYINNNFQITPDEWKAYPVLVDLQQALVEAVKFYVGVLIKPDVMCAVSVMGSSRVSDVVPLRRVSSTALHCFDNLNPSSFLQPIAQGGAFFRPQSSGDADASMGEIDIQGVWMDKLLAWRYLFSRKLNIPPLDHYNDSFMQLTQLKPILNKLIEDTLLDQVTAPVKMDFVFGYSEVLNVRHHMFALNPATRTADPAAHIVPEALHPMIRQLFDLPDESSFFQPLLLKMLHAYAPSDLHYWSGRELSHSLSVFRQLEGRDADQYVSFSINEQPYFVSPTSELALKMAFRLLVVRHLQTYDPKVLQKILDRHKSLPKQPDKPDEPETGEPEAGEPETGEPEAGEPKTGEPEGGTPKMAQEQETTPTPNPKPVPPAPPAPAPGTGPKVDPLFTQAIDNLGLKVITPIEVQEFLFRAYHGPEYYEYMLEKMATHTHAP